MWFYIHILKYVHPSSGCLPPSSSNVPVETKGWGGQSGVGDPGDGRVRRGPHYARRSAPDRATHGSRVTTRGRQRSDPVRTVRTERSHPGGGESTVLRADPRPPSSRATSTFDAGWPVPANDTIGPRSRCRRLPPVDRRRGFDCRETIFLYLLFICFVCITWTGLAEKRRQIRP
jgi:hypothetical protein